MTNNDQPNKVNINWDDTSNAKTYSNYWKIKLFYLEHLY